TNQPEKDEGFVNLPVFAVHGELNGVPWTNAFSLSSAAEKPGTYAVRVPKGLDGVTLRFGEFVQPIRVGANSPLLFRPTFRRGPAQADEPEITIYRYRETTLTVRVDPADGAQLPDGFKLQARYVRESAMRAAGVVIDTPLPIAEVNGG